MKYGLKYGKAVTKFLKKHNEVAPRVLEKLEILAQNPYQNTLDIAKLDGYEHHYRLRVGKYRLLYEIIESQILIYAYDIDSRGDVYKGQKCKNS